MSTLSIAAVLLASGLYCASVLAESPPSAEPPTTEANQAAIQAAPRAPLIERTILNAQAIQLSSDAEQLISLSTPTEHFSALFLPANVGVARGLVVLLPGTGETFDWPTTIGPLRRKLPNAGWHTLSLNLPEPPAAALTANQLIAEPVAEQIVIQPPAPIETPAETALEDEVEPEAEVPEPVDEPVEEPAEEETAPPLDDDANNPELLAPEPLPLPVPDYPERISNFIDAAIAYAASLNAPEVILLGHREGAHWALAYQSQHNSAVPIRTVLIAAHSDTAIEESFENLINASVHPIADFYYKNPANNDREALRRLNASRRAQLQQYHQIGLSAESGVQSIDQELLFRRVKGWLNKPQKPE